MEMKRMLMLLTAALGLAGLSCERSTDPEGPSLNDLYGEFSVLQQFDVSTQNVDFSNNGSMYFEALFSKRVDWKVTITGQNSGAVKEITGSSFVVDESNSTWTGGVTQLPMVKVEPCEVVLSVENEGFADTLYINVRGLKSNEGFVVADFETGLNPGWNIFAQTGADMSFNIVQSDSAGEGTHYYDMGGEVSWDYLIGLIDFPASAYGETHFPLDGNPANVYFNVFLNVPEGITNEIVLFQFREDENGDGQYQGATEDMWSLELRGLDPGWQLVSLRYDGLVALVNGQPAPPAGNGIHEPDKLIQLSLLFLADPATGYSQTLLDYIIFTEKNPLRP